MSTHNSSLCPLFLSVYVHVRVHEDALFNRGEGPAEAHYCYATLLDKMLLLPVRR